MSAMPMPLRPRHWILALAGALLLHGALLLMFHQLARSGTVAPGRGGIEVGLPPPGAAAGAQAGEVAPAEAPAVPPEAVAEAAASAELATTPAPSGAEPLYAPVETVEAVVPPEQPLSAPAIPPAEPVTAEAAPVEPMQETVAGSVMAVPPPPRAKPRPPEAPASRDSEVAEAEPAEPATESGKPAPSAGSAQSDRPAEDAVAGNDGKAGSGARAATGADQGRSGGGAPGAFVDYKAELLAWLEKHKEYPRRARLRRQEGTAVLHFVMDRSGRVIEYSIQESSGHRLLDEEVVAMIRRASPLPPPPPALSGDRLGYTVPVAFFQR